MNDKWTNQRVTEKSNLEKLLVTETKIFEDDALKKKLQLDDKVSIFMKLLEVEIEAKPGQFLSEVLVSVVKGTHNYLTNI